MRMKDRKWLVQVQEATDTHGGGMYHGLRADFLPPTVAKRLGDFIERYSPHNPIHLDRYIITSTGREALNATGGNQ